MSVTLSAMAGDYRDVPLVLAVEELAKGNNRHEVWARTKLQEYRESVALYDRKLQGDRCPASPNFLARECEKCQDPGEPLHREGMERERAFARRQVVALEEFLGESASVGGAGKSLAS